MQTKNLNWAQAYQVMLMGHAVVPEVGDPIWVFDMVRPEGWADTPFIRRIAVSGDAPRVPWQQHIPEDWQQTFEMIERPNAVALELSRELGANFITEALPGIFRGEKWRRAVWPDAGMYIFQREDGVLCIKRTGRDAVPWPTPPQDMNGYWYQMGTPSADQKTIDAFNHRVDLSFRDRKVNEAPVTAFEALKAALTQGYLITPDDNAREVYNSWALRVIPTSTEFDIPIFQRVGTDPNAPWLGLYDDLFGIARWNMFVDDEHRPAQDQSVIDRLVERWATPQATEWLMRGRVSQMLPPKTS